MEHTTDIDEQKIIERITAYIRRGDRRAAATEYAYIVRKYSKIIIAFVARMVISRTDAEDLAQNAFVKAFNNIETYEHRANFGSWLARIAYNESITHLRHKQHHFVNIEDTILDNTADIDDRELSTGREERISLMEKALDILTPDERMLVHLYYYEDKPMREISFIMDAEPNTLTVRLLRIRKKLFSAIQKMEQELPKKDFKIFFAFLCSIL